MKRIVLKSGANKGQSPPLYIQSDSPTDKAIVCESNVTTESLNTNNLICTGESSVHSQLRFKKRILNDELVLTPASHKTLFVCEYQKIQLQIEEVLDLNLPFYVTINLRNSSISFEFVISNLSRVFNINKTFSTIDLSKETKLKGSGEITLQTIFQTDNSTAILIEGFGNFVKL